MCNQLAAFVLGQLVHERCVARWSKTPNVATNTQSKRKLNDQELEITAGSSPNLPLLG